MRYYKIFKTFFSHIFQYWWFNYGDFQNDNIESNFYKTLVDKFEELGPCWIKLGQWMSTRPDIFSKFMTQEGQRLHDCCRKHSFKDTFDIIKSEFGKEIGEIFYEFNEEPVASGAIGQVYKAKILKNGQYKKVAVKVMHPWAKSEIKEDLDTLLHFAKLLERIAYFRNANTVQAFQEFRSAMENQLDFTKEAENIEIFRKNFKNWNDIFFTQVHYPYVSEKVLVMNFEEGIMLNKILNNLEDYSTFFLKQLSYIGVMAFYKMFLKDRFLHVDLHPGNILVKIKEVTKYFEMEENETIETMELEPSEDPTEGKDSKKEIFYDENFNKFLKLTYNIPQMVLLDCGLSFQIPENDAKRMQDLFLCFVDFKYRESAEIMWSFSNKKNDTNADELFELFTKKIMDLFTPLKHSNIEQLEMAKIFNDSMIIMHEFGIRFEPNFANLVISVIILEGMGKKLDKTLNIPISAAAFRIEYKDWEKKCKNL